MTYRPTIGLEIHAELKTKTKMFCCSKNAPDDSLPNVHICPVCMAHPGTLPVINKEAVRQVLRVGTALGGTLADYSEFDRKSYFYPDIPKGYQISQYKYPLVSGGMLAGVPITRVHLEEDTARSSHEGNKSVVDFNRAGVPLMELVTDPAMHSAEEAGRFAGELQLLLRTLGASGANLEKGEMRIEANVSVSPNETPSVAYVEIKNINSFRAVEKAILYEIERQSKLLDEGKPLVKETRGWDENKEQTFHQRFKEGAADYRYFPDPDLPKLKLSEYPEFSHETIRASLPELPDESRARYRTLGVKDADVETILGDLTLSALFDEVLMQAQNNEEIVRLSANYLISDVTPLLRASFKEGEVIELNKAHFVKLMEMIAKAELSSRAAKDILVEMYATGVAPEEIAKTKGLLQISDPEAVRKIVRELLEENVAIVAEYRSGKEAGLQFLVGQTMKAMKGAGNPNTIREVLLEEISK